MTDRGYRVAIGFNLVLDPAGDPTGQRFDPGIVIRADAVPPGLDVEPLLAQGVLRVTTVARALAAEDMPDQAEAGGPRRRRRPATIGDGGDA